MQALNVINRLSVSATLVFGAHAQADEVQSLDAFGDGEPVFEEYVVKPSGKSPVGRQIVQDDDLQENGPVLYSVWAAAAKRNAQVQNNAFGDENRLPLSNVKDALKGYGERVQDFLPENFTVDYSGDVNDTPSPGFLSLGYEVPTRLGDFKFWATGDAGHTFAKDAKDGGKDIALPREKTAKYQTEGIGLTWSFPVSGF